MKKVNNLDDLLKKFDKKDDKLKKKIELKRKNFNKIQKK